MAEPGVILPPVHRREALARTWTRSAISSSYIPRSAEDIEALLLELVDEMLAILGAEPFSTSAGLRLGHRLINEGFIDPPALTATITTLSEGLLADLEVTPDTELAKRTMELLGAVSAGYADGLRSYTLTQQEEVKQALFNAVLRAEHNLRGTENRFREVFTSSATGILITSLDGMCIEANPALAGILGLQGDGLPGRMLTDIFRDEMSGDVMAPYRRILAGEQARVHEQRRLRKEDGSKHWRLLSREHLSELQADVKHF